MKKIFTGIVISNKMQKTAVVEITRKTPHPLYKKIIKKSRNYKVDTAGFTVSTGDTVKIAETKPISKDKYFEIIEILNKKPATIETQKKTEAQNFNNSEVVRKVKTQKRRKKNDST